MALRLDDEWLESVGLGTMPSEDRASFLAHVRETLEMRVGRRLAGDMSEVQLDEY